MKAERIVLDTNVIISALLSPHGKSFGCLSFVLDNASLLISRELLDELATGLARPKFAKYVNESKCRAVVSQLALTAVSVELRGIVRVCRDPDDDKVLETAVLGRADCIVTGDNGLLILGQFQNIPILTPAGFLERIQRSRQL